MALGTTWSSSHHVVTPSRAPSRSHHSQCAGGARGTMQGVPGEGVRGLGSLTQPLRQGPVRPSPRISLTRSPILLARQAPEEGPVEHQAPLHGPTGGLRDLLFCLGQRAKHGSRPLLRRGTGGLNFSSSSTYGWRRDSGTSRAPFRAQERSRHLHLFREHFTKCVRGSSGAPPEVNPGPYSHAAHFVIP